MMCQVMVRSRWRATSSIHREVIQANGQIGSNQKSTLIGAGIRISLLGRTRLAAASPEYPGPLTPKELECPERT
ncbi:hypothetical protein GCM10027427_31750 [Pseudoclavibacter terrae]